MSYHFFLIGNVSIVCSFLNCDRSHLLLCEDHAPYERIPILPSVIRKAFSRCGCSLTMFCSQRFGYWLLPLNIKSVVLPLPCDIIVRLSSELVRIDSTLEASYRGFLSPHPAHRLRLDWHRMMEFLCYMNRHLQESNLIGRSVDLLFTQNYHRNIGISSSNWCFGQDSNLRYLHLRMVDLPIILPKHNVAAIIQTTMSSQMSRIRTRLYVRRNARVSRLQLVVLPFWLHSALVTQGQTYTAAT